MKQNETFSLRRIIIFGHLVEKLKSFYVDHFNFSVREEMEGQWVVLNTGPVELAIHKIGQGYEPEAGKKFRAESNTKLVFQTRENLKDLRQQLVHQGVIMGEIKSFEGFHSMFCDGEDPEGNVFQIEQRLD